MDLSRAFGFEEVAPNFAQKATHRVAASRPGACLFSKTLHHVDANLMKASRGRLSVSGMMAGLPVLVLTTTGAKTGVPRTSPLLGIPHADDIVLVGTGWGQSKTPGWVANLRVNPHAKLSASGVEIDVFARKAAGAEEPELWEEARRIYPGYAKYPLWAAHRQISVFVVSAVD
jgi:deazaflavin-dependent oxidoreductase (nitroreductase family)